MANLTKTEQRKKKHWTVPYLKWAHAYCYMNPSEHMLLDDWKILRKKPTRINGLKNYDFSCFPKRRTNLLKCG